MRLADALALRRQLVAHTDHDYTVMRSGKRSLNVSPFYVRRGTASLTSANRSEREAA